MNIHSVFVTTDVLAYGHSGLALVCKGLAHSSMNSQRLRFCCMVAFRTLDFAMHVDTRTVKSSCFGQSECKVLLIY